MPDKLSSDSLAPNHQGRCSPPLRTSYVACTFAREPGKHQRRTLGLYRQLLNAFLMARLIAQLRWRPVATFLNIAVCTCRSGVTASIASISSQTPLDPGEDFTATWSYEPSDGLGGTTGDIRSFAIALVPCASDCASCAESSSILPLCPAGGFCMDSDGSYDLSVPADASSGRYLLKVALGSDPAVFACSDALDIGLATTESGPTSTVNGASLTAFAPDVSPEPGQAFTARWEYDDGTGSAKGYFDVDLYRCKTGDCGAGDR